MARKPAVLTRGTISGRPAKVTWWPRSVRTRATPRLGGRFPPPDQFSQRIRFAICALPLDDTIDHLQNDRFRGRARETHVAANKLPDINVGQHCEGGEQARARRSRKQGEVRRKSCFHAEA